MIPIVNGFDNFRVDNVEREKGNKKYFCDEFSLKILYVGALNNIAFNNLPISINAMAMAMTSMRRKQLL